MLGRPLHHIALGTPRVEVLAAFYEEVLGLKRIRSHQDSNNELRSIWLRSDTVVLMVERTAYLESMEHEPLRSGWATLIFEVRLTRSDSLKMYSDWVVPETVRPTSRTIFVIPTVIVLE